MIIKNTYARSDKLYNKKVQLTLFLVVLLNSFSVQTVLSQVLQTYNSGSNTSWTVPAGVTYIKVEAWGAGGHGGSRTSGSGSYGGGGGGAYASSVLEVSPGDIFYIHVGAGSNNTNPGGDSWFTTTSNNTPFGALVLAKGGNTVANNSTIGANGGDYKACIGDVRNNGGRGAEGNHNSYGGGGGGSSAGSTGIGVNATNNFGAIAPTGDDGIGGNGQGRNDNGNGNGSSGLAPGGGGGGARSTSGLQQTGGNGANGRVIITDLSALSYNLSIDATANNTRPVVGTNVVFTVSVTNHNVLDAEGVEVLNQLPSGFTYVSHTASTQTSYNNETGIWNIGTLNGNNTATLTITATVNPSGSYANEATMSADLENRNLSYSNITLFPQQPTVNLQLSKEVDNYMPLMDEEVEFTLTVYNAGPQDATGVVIQDILPFGLSYVSDSGGYNSSTGIWTIGTLNNGATVTMTLIARVNPTGNHYNQAVVSGNEFDPDLSNNTSEIRVYPMYPLTEIVLPCGAMEYDLTSIAIGTPPPGAELSWHNESPADYSNKISTPNNVRTGQTYYISYYDPVQNCYGSTSEVKITRSCLITNPMIRQLMKK